VLRQKMSEADYQKIIILMLKEDSLRKYAKLGRVRLFDDIAIKASSNEIHFGSEDELFAKLDRYIYTNEREQLTTKCELDILSSKDPLKFPDDFECIVSDNEKVKSQVEAKINGINIPVYVSPLPREKFADRSALY
jgi:hypothetical protein